MSLPPMPAFLDSDADLSALVGLLEGVDRLVVDTEFHAERRFLPELMLVQVGHPDGRVWVIDPRRVNLGLLRPVLERVTWVLHGGASDVMLLHHATGARPPALIDTQVQAALLGLDYPLRLDALARHVLDVSLDKGATLTDWSHRPLRPEQLRYAAADVRITAELATSMWQLLDPERRRWTLAAGAELVEEALAEPDPNRGWRNLDVAPELDTPTRAALDALCRWRVRVGRATDQPPYSILSDGLLLDLARRRPTDLAGLADNRRIPPGLIKRHGDAMVLELRLSASRLESAPSVLARDQLQIVRILHVWAGALERENGISARLLLAGDRAQKVVAEGLDAWVGWRQEAAGSSLAALMAGAVRIGISDGKSRLFES